MGRMLATTRRKAYPFPPYLQGSQRLFLICGSFRTGPSPHRGKGENQVVQRFGILSYEVLEDPQARVGGLAARFKTRCSIYRFLPTELLAANEESKLGFERCAFWQKLILAFLLFVAQCWIRLLHQEIHFHFLEREYALEIKRLRYGFDYRIHGESVVPHVQSNSISYPDRGYSLLLASLVAWCYLEGYRTVVISYVISGGGSHNSRDG